MCGIAGKINFNHSHIVSEKEIREMITPITLRGPDDEGIFLDSNVGLGFKRLSIIDLSSGHQPLSNYSKNLWITFNGEIYNYRELRSELEQKGYRFNTKTDTEVIINLYEEYGEDCVNHLRGMFAFMIYNQKTKKLFGARDRFGIKPFFYIQTNNSFYWASEIKALKNTEDFSNEINILSLDYYFAYGNTPREDSIYANIKKLKPGHYVSIDLNTSKVDIGIYWEINFQPDLSLSIDDWAEQLRDEFQNSVRMRMVSDVPLGAFLSGGIDSSAVVAAMSEYSTEPIKTFSIGFKEKKYNELDKARIIAKTYKTDHYEQIVGPESVDLISNLVSIYDEPFADSSAIPTYILSRFTRQHVTVALSGDGGDELFAGYKHMIKMYQMVNNPLLRNSLSRFVFTNIHKLIPEYFPSKGLTYFLSKNSKHIGAYHTFMYSNSERLKLYSSSIRTGLNNFYAEDLRTKLIDDIQGDYLSTLQSEIMQTYLVDQILTKVDRASMANSLEVRVPILDHKFAELSFRIPSKYKYHKGEMKYIFKKAIANYLPDEIMNQRKAGFGVPLRYWFNSDLYDYVNEKLSSSNKLFNYLDKKYVIKMLDYHKKGLRDYGSKLWTLLIFNEWLEQQ